MQLSSLGILGLMLLSGSGHTDCPGAMSGEYSMLSVEQRGCCSHHLGVGGSGKDGPSVAMDG